MIGALVGAGVLELKPMLQHVLTAGPPDADPADEPAIVDSGDALKLLGALLQQVRKSRRLSLDCNVDKLVCAGIAANSAAAVRLIFCYSLVVPARSAWL